MKNIINTKGNFDAQGSKITQTNKNIKITVGTVVIVVVMITSFLFLINTRLYNFINDTLVAESTVLGH